MNKWLQDKFIFIFPLIVSVVLYANIVDSFILNLLFKPLIVLSLLAYLITINGHKSKAAYLAIGGLLFSLLGDILLIFQDRQTLFFIGGLIAFLIAHLLYIGYYIRSSGNTTKWLHNRYIFYIIMLIYGTGFYILLYNNLAELKVPVFFYTAVLICMNIFALQRYGKVNDKSFRLIMTGALFFTLSDSILALNKFYLPVPLAGVWIISTYAVAQYFITKGVIHLTPVLSAGKGVNTNKL